MLKSIGINSLDGNNINLLIKHNINSHSHIN